MVAGRLCRFLILAAAIAWWPGASAQQALGLQDAFEACIDYHCDATRKVQLSALQWEEVRAEFSEVRDAETERAAIRRAVASLEEQVGKITGTWQDLAMNRTGAGLPGQLDCIAESRNTMTYLELMARDGLLRWHTVEERVQRTLWLVMVHWTAVIRDSATGRRYAVDSWVLDNGQPPFIQPLEHWLQGEDFANAQ